MIGGSAVKRDVWRAALACLLAGGLFGLTKLLFELAGGSFGTMLYCCFLGISCCLAAGARACGLPGYLLSLAVGLVWVGLYTGAETALLATALPPLAARVLAFGAVSAVIEAANLFWLKRTPARHAILQFSAIIGCFSRTPAEYPAVAAAIVTGIVVSILYKGIYGALRDPDQ